MEFDLLHVGVTLGGVILTVAIVKNDLKWIKEWMHEHKEVHTDIEARLRKVELSK